MQRTVFLLIAITLIASTAVSGDAGRLQRHGRGIWSIAGTEADSRWIVIHNLPEAAKTGIYHIEVLARVKSDPKWKVDHIRPHLAITEQALDRSVVSPLSCGAVYPESFDDVYRTWKEVLAQGGAFICETTVLECIGRK